jgi:hypothetical protein
VGFASAANGIRAVAGLDYDVTGMLQNGSKEFAAGSVIVSYEDCLHRLCSLYDNHVNESSSQLDII